MNQAFPQQNPNDAPTKPPAKKRNPLIIGAYFLCGFALIAAIAVTYQLNQNVVSVFSLINSDIIPTQASH
jgi:hypothetical protein